MKRWSRILSIILVMILLTCTCSAVADVNLDPEAMQNAEGIELEIDPNNDEVMEDISQNPGEGLELEGVALPNLELDVATIDATSAENTLSPDPVPVQPNDSSDDFVIDEEGTLTEYKGDGGDVVIPKDVLTIGKSVFALSSLTSIIIPEGVEYIEEDAFFGCDGLTSLTIPSSVVEIQKGAFEWCSLTVVTILADAIDIDDYAFDPLVSFRIVSGSNAIEWAENNDYDYTVIDTLSETKLILAPGETRKLTVYGQTDGTITWSTSNKKVATVKNGKVTAVKYGKCTITATIRDNKKLTCKVTVKDTAQLSETDLKISAVDSMKLMLTGRSKRKVTWASSNSNVIKIVKGTTTYATIKAVKPGTATITAKLAANKTAGARTLKCKVKVISPLTIKSGWDDSFDDLASWEVGVKFTNNSDKRIIYVTFDILQYNNRGDRLKSPYDYYYFNNNIEPHDYYYDNYTVNDDTRSVKFRIKEITFADKTKWKP